MEKLTKQDYSKAKKFNNTSRFIDDLGTLNNDGILVTEKAKIYQVELMLSVQNQDDNHATFLDIEVNVEGDQFKTKTYDKIENYKFEITNKLIKTGFTINRLKNTMKKCLGKHSWIAKKYKGMTMQNLYWCRKYQ